MTWNSTAPLNGQGAKLCQYVALSVCVCVSVYPRPHEPAKPRVDTGNKIDYASAYWLNETS